jgi:hypothetical protein
MTGWFKLSVIRMKDNPNLAVAPCSIGLTDILFSTAISAKDNLYGTDG